MGGKGSGGARTKKRPDDRRGRPVSKAVIHEGSGLLISQVYPDGIPDGMANLGRGTATIEAHGRDRIIKIAQEDGSEIRILVVG